VRDIGLGGNRPRPVPVATGVDWTPPSLRPGKPDAGLIANPEDDPDSVYYIDDEPATVLPTPVLPTPTPKPPSELKPGKPDPGLEESPEDDPESVFYVDDEPATVIEEETESEQLPFVLLGGLAFVVLVSIFFFGEED
jgi:hypothetical protein